MHRFLTLRAASLLLAAASAIAAPANAPAPLIVTANNLTSNSLLVYNASGHLLQTISTGGKGGVSGNAGGIEAHNGLIAVVNYTSQSVSIFTAGFNALRLSQTIATLSNPVSVAFSDDHLYILGTTEVESHRIFDSYIASSSDGSAHLLKADGSAAQVGVLPGQLIITEKSNVIETVGLTSSGEVTGAATLVTNIPANVNTPFGLVTRGNDAYVTIAHANEISLVRNGAVLTTTGSGTQMAPCWLTLRGPFLFSSNSPSMSVSRYAVYGQHIVQDAAVAASLNGDPTDIASGSGLIAVVSASGSVSTISIFTVDEDGNLTLAAAPTVTAPANGIAIVEPKE